MKQEVFFLRSKVARRVFVLFVFCALFPLVLLAYFSYDHITGQLTEEAYVRLHHTSKASSMAIVERMLSLERDLELLTSEASGAGEMERGLDDVRWRARLSTRFEELTVVHDAALGMPGSSAAGLPVLDQADQQHLAAGNRLLAVRSTEESGTALFLVCTLEPRWPGETLFAEIRSEYLLGGGLSRDESEPFAVYDSEGLLYSVDPRAHPERELRESMRQNPAFGRLTWEHAGETFASTYRALFLLPQYGSNLMVVHSRPRADVLAPVHRFRTIFGLVMFLTFLVVLLLSLVQIRRSLVPIVQLRQATRRIAADDLEGRVAIASKDEFEELGAAFNDMASRIQQRTAELERANRAKSAFLANMSHEMRTPLTAILGYAQLSRSGDASADELQRHLEIICSNGEHLLEVIDDVLDVARIQAGTVAIRRRTCSAGRILQEVVDLVRGHAEEKSLELRVEDLADIPEAVTTDPTRLRQILINVIGNAVKFTETGSVTVSATFDRPRELLTMSVHDTGVGIPAGEIESIFVPFEQVDTSMSREHGGTGLGLFIVRSLARKLGGDVTCESELGAGSRFSITIGVGPLPVQPAAGGNGPSPFEGPGPASGPSITTRLEGCVLLAEDVPVNRRLIATLLRRLGLEVDEVQDGRAALEKALEARDAGTAYDLVFMDMQMPGMDGYEATQELRAQDYAGPIVALTSHAVAGDREACLEAGCDDYATKPIDGAELRRVVLRYLAPERRQAS